MSSEQPEKNPPISRLKLYILCVISGLILNFVLGLFLHYLIAIAITFIVVLPVFTYFSFKYYHKPLRWGLPKREGSQCPHHPGEELVSTCSICEIPICVRCQNFKTEMRNFYQDNFRLGHKPFEQSACVDCIFKQMDLAIKILYILVPVGFSAGLGLIIASLYVETFLFIMFLILGIIFSLIGIVSIINILLVSFFPERKKIDEKFQATK